MLAEREGLQRPCSVVRPRSSLQQNKARSRSLADVGRRSWGQRGIPAEVVETVETATRGTECDLSENTGETWLAVRLCAAEADTIERLWQSRFKRYNQVLTAKGGNDFEVQYTDTKKRKPEEGLVKKVPVDREAAAAALE